MAMPGSDISDTVCAKPANPWEQIYCGVSLLGPTITGGICAVTGNCQDAVSGVTTPPPGQQQPPAQQASGNQNLLLYGGLGLGGLLLLVVLRKVL